MNIVRIIFGIMMLLLCTTQAYAVSYEEMNKQIAEFEESGQSRYAPKSMKKVIAYQGASMLAYEQQGSAFSKQARTTSQTEQLQHAIDATLKALDIAKSNAHTFTSKHRMLLELEKEAEVAFVYHHKPKKMPDMAVNEYYNHGKEQMDIAITATEQGKLNLADQAIKNSNSSYNKCIDAAMSGLIEQTQRAMSQASSLGAERFAPRLWAKTEAEFTLLEEYHDDIQRPAGKRHGVKRPQSIGLAYELAVFTQQMAIQVKEWRHDNGGHEKLALDARQLRLDIAGALQLPLDYNKVGIDIEAEKLVKEVKALKDSLVQAEKMKQQMRAKLEEEYELKLAKQRSEDQQMFTTKIANIKSAFNTKLEQETFETKRHKKVHALFKDSEADIVANLDGSLMIRARKINFEANSSKIGGQYFEFLGRIKEALNIYPERKVVIEGHTDSTGDEQVNRKLSLKRAEAIQEFLIAAGVDPNRLKALGYGEVKPIASNMYKKGRAMNRRIDIIIKAE